MTDKVKLRATITWEYEANPEYYGTDVPAEMAKVDEAVLYESPAGFLEGAMIAHNPGLSLKVEPASVRRVQLPVMSDLLFDLTLAWLRDELRRHKGTVVEQAIREMVDAMERA